MRGPSRDTPEIASLRLVSARPCALTAPRGAPHISRRRRFGRSTTALVRRGSQDEPAAAARRDGDACGPPRGSVGAQGRAPTSRRDPISGVSREGVHTRLHPVGTAPKRGLARSELIARTSDRAECWYRLKRKAERGDLCKQERRL